MNITEQCKKWRYICVIVWGMMFVLNMVSYLWTRSSISLFLAGFMLGGVLIQLINNPHMNWQDKFIDEILKKWGKRIESIEKYIRILKLKKNKNPKRKIKI